MREMKDSGIEWIGDIPKEWKVRPLRSKYSFNKGLSITKADLVDEGVCVISYGQIHSKDNKGVSIRDSLIRYLPPDHRNLTETSKTHVGDFIFADTSEDLQGCGNCIYVDRDDVYAGYHTLILRPKEIGHSRYYAFLFSADAWRAQIRASVSGVKLFSITQDILKSTAILEPPIDVQIRIVDYLDKKCSEIDALIAAKEKTNALLRERRQSIIYEAVTKGLDPNAPMKDSGVEWIGEIPAGWSTRKAKHIGIFKSGNSITAEAISEENDYPVYGGNGIRGYTSNYTHNGSYVLIGRQGALCGNVHLVDGAFWASEHAVVGDITSDYDTRLAFYVLTSFNLNRLSVTAAQPGISVDQIENVILPVPSNRDEQKNICDYLDSACRETNSVIAKNEVIIHQLKEYRQSLIYEAVTGKIEV